MKAPVAALYVDTRGPYPALVQEWYDETRDARKYAGTLPVIAHPPCGPWGQLRHMCTKQDASLAPIAVEQVRRWGGVLEHPAHSKLWEHCGLPLPGELPDAHGGRSIEVCQVDYGHVARKRTWLYLVGIHSAGQVLPAREPTHWCSVARRTHWNNAGRPKGGGTAPPHIKVCSAQQRRRTPIDFARFLIEIALSVRR